MNFLKRLAQPTPIFKFYRFRKQAKAALSGEHLNIFRDISDDVESMITSEGFGSMRDMYLSDANREGTPNAMQTCYTVAFNAYIKKIKESAPSPDAVRDRIIMTLQVHEKTLQALCIMKGYGLEDVSPKMADLMQEHLGDG